MGREYGVAGARSPETFFQVMQFPCCGESYMLSAGMGNISYLWGREREFCEKFAPFVGNGNIEQLAEENRTALLHISQNGNAKIVFTHYALSVSKLIGRRQ